MLEDDELKDVTLDNVLAMEPAARGHLNHWLTKVLGSWQEKFLLLDAADKEGEVGIELKRLVDFMKDKQKMVQRTVMMSYDSSSESSAEDVGQGESPQFS